MLYAAVRARRANKRNTERAVEVEEGVMLGSKTFGDVHNAIDLL
jgi:hypothetical protein